MRKDRNEALKLRLKGLSYRQIQESLDIPKSTLSSWLSKVELSDSLKEKINFQGRREALKQLIIRNQRQTELAQRRARSERTAAKKDVDALGERDLFIAGVALYWAEGYKRQKKRNDRLVTYHPVSLANSDPSLIKLFLKFLREICGVEENRIRASIRIFPHQNELQLLEFWMKETGISESAFGKTYTGVSSASKKIRPFDQLPYGMIQIRVSDTRLYNRIMGWIDGMANLG